MASGNLDCREICKLTGEQLVVYLRKAVSTRSETAVSDFLIEAVESGGITPRVFRVWLDNTASPKSLKAALQSRSRNTRRYAFGKLGSLLRCPQWQVVWEDMGGTLGWLRLLHQSSTEDVNHAIRAVRKGHSTQPVDTAKHAKTTELMKSLFPDLFPNSPLKTEDSRQLAHVYIRLLPVCSTDFVFEFLDLLSQQSSKISYNARDTDLFLQNHLEAIRGATAERILEEEEEEHASQSEQSKRSRDWIDGWRSALLATSSATPSKKYSRWSRSMEFSFELLQKLVNVRKSKIMGPDKVMNELIMPLLRRSLQRRAGTRSHAMIIEAALDYARSHPRAAGLFGRAQGYFNASLGRCQNFESVLVHLWQRKPDVYERLFVDSLEMRNGRRDGQQDVGKELFDDDLDWSLNLVKREMRYRLLRLYGLHAAFNSIDIDEASAATEAARVPWGEGVFTAMEPEAAAALLDRLRRAADKPLEIRSFGKPLTPQDIQLLSLSLRRGNIEAIEEARELVTENIRLASRTRDKTDRLKYASAALKYAFTVGSLPLLKNVVDFLKRFVKDPDAGRELFNSKNMWAHQHIELLSGLDSIGRGGNAESVKADIDVSDDIMRVYLDILFRAAREPSFKGQLWATIPITFERVVSERLKKAELRLRDELSLSDDQIYDLVWVRTLQLWVEAEGKWIQADHRMLISRDTRGPYDSCIGISVEQLGRHSAHFIDELARKRNELWKNLRLETNSDVALLAFPWPQGLPVKSLHPFRLRGRWITGAGQNFLLTDMPYLASRANEVVFMSREVANAPNPPENLQDAIGLFIESYEDSLYFLVKLAGKAEQREIIQAAWKHAISTLSDHLGLDEKQKGVYWVDMFNGLEDSISEKSHKQQRRDERQTTVNYSRQTLDAESLLIPGDADFENLNEWNPADTGHAPVRNYNNVPFPLIAITVLSDDDLRNPESVNFEGKRGWKVRGYLESPHMDWAGYFKHFSSMQLPLPGKHKFGRPDFVESLLAASLLFLDYKKGDPARVLRESFPESLASKRLPPLLLDAEFAADKRNRVEDALRLLWQVKSSIPAQALLYIVREGLAKLQQQDVDTQPTEATMVMFNCLSMIVSSDMPAVGREEIYSAVISLPDASSWHRQILNKGLMKRLSPPEANEFVKQFARQIFATNDARLRGEKELKQSGKSAEEIEKELQSLPFVKITTIKQLAQLLDAGDVFGFDTAVGILFQLLDNFRQLDVRASVLESLLGLIRDAPDSALAGETNEKLMSNLRRLIPVIGGLSERYTTDDKFWAAVDLKAPLPEVGKEFPLWDKLFQASSDSQLPEHFKEFVRREILLPSLAHSIDANQRWLALFAEKHRLGIDVSKYAGAPVNADRLRQTVDRFKDWLPKSFLTALHERKLLEFLQPQELVQACTKVTKDPKLGDKEEAKHWLLMMNFSDRSTPLSHACHVLSNMLLRNQQEASASDISTEDIKGYYRNWAERILDVDETSLSLWDKFVSSFTEAYRYVYWHVDLEKNKDHPWHDRFGPLVEQLLELLQSKRPPQWLDASNVSRFPRRLPDPLDLRIWLIRRVGKHMKDEERKVANDQTVADVLALYDELARARPATYYKKLDTLAVAMMRAESADHAYMIAQIGNVEAEHLSGGDSEAARAMGRIDLAGRAIKRLDPPSKYHIGNWRKPMGLLKDTDPEEFNGHRAELQLRKMVQSWSLSAVEEIRDLAWELEDQLKWLKEFV